jgi:hypothetical protein
MRILRKPSILLRGSIERKAWFQKICAEIETAIRSVVYPANKKTFVIRPTRKGNGVNPIKLAFVKCLKEEFNWELEKPLAISSSADNAGPIDAVKFITKVGKHFAVEWETGNISSTHRALNKIALGILQGKLVGGALVLPSRELYKYLTDRIGNFHEIEPYFSVWKNLKCPADCIIRVYEIEHDATDTTVPLIPKGKDGMAQGLVSSRLPRAKLHRRPLELKLSARLRKRKPHRSVHH